MNDNELKTLFKDGCPEPRDSAGFRSRVLEHTHKLRSSGRAGLWKSPGGRAVELLLSPLPVVTAAAVLIAIYGEQLSGLLGGLVRAAFSLTLEQLTQSPVLIAVCCISAVGCILFYISQLSRVPLCIDTRQIDIELEKKRL